MSKKTIRLLTAGLLAVLLCVLADAGLAATAHRHEWKLKLTVEEPTCTEAGVGYYTCTCGERKKDSIPALGHDWGNWKTTKEPTCSKAGSKTRTCSRCGKKETQSIPATGKHSFVWKTVKEAACAEKGKEEQVCVVCKAKGKTRSVAATGKHQYGEWKVTKAATCGSKGTETRKCKTCDKKETRNVSALGHSWDKGVITQPAGLLEPGVKTYTCGRCGKTKTEEIPAEKPKSGSIIDLLRNGPVGPEEDENSLRIVKQPEGGTIEEEGGSVELSVEVEGGVPPYTYKWRRRPKGDSLFGFIFPWITVDGAVGSTYNADLGRYRYYCHIQDDAGNEISSDEVYVSPGLYILTQPENVNLYTQEGPATLSCTADGGTPREDGTYLYRWFGPDGQLLQESSDGNCQASALGEYYCEVWDRNRSVTSATAVVYDAMRLLLSAGTYRPDDEDSLAVRATVRNGVPPYTFTMSLDGKTVSFTETEEGDRHEYCHWICKDGVMVSGFGTYTFHVEDSMGAENKKTIPFVLTIEVQPEPSSMLPPGGEGVPLYVRLSEYDAPVFYTVYKDGKPVDSFTLDSPEATWTATAPGEYYYRIQDAQGLWTNSTKAVVRDYFFAVDHIEKSGDISASGDGVTLTAVVNGGVEPVTYDWWFDEERNGKVSGSVRLAEKAGAVFTADAPGLYWCHAKDATGAIDRSEAVRVERAGTAPVINVHPVNIALDYDPLAPASGRLSCEAAAADGRTDCLAYNWEYKARDGWHRSGDTAGSVIVQYNPAVLAWRCTVTDTRNGESTVSREGAVTSKVYCTILSVTGDMKSDGNICIRYEVNGGKAPYTVQVCASRAAGRDEERFSSLLGSETVRDSKSHVFRVKNDQYYKYFVRTSGGSYDKKGSRPDFYLVVQDADGDTYTTDIYPGR